MGVNRVDFGGKTLIDLTGDTLESAEQLLKGIIAHAKDGSVLTGLMEAGGGTGSGYATGTYTVASDINIGVDISKALKIDTGLSEVKIFAFSKNIEVSSTSEYELLSGIWVYNNGDYYGIRYHKYTSSNSARYAQNLNNQYTGENFYNEGNGVMSIKGLTSSTRIFAGTEYLWLAI